MTHILLLEDERLLREDLTEFLVKQGHSVQAVGSIAEFESGFVPGRHLIAILDLGLPDGDGMDVIARLRLGIIVLTARMAMAPERDLCHAILRWPAKDGKPSTPFGNGS